MSYATQSTPLGEDLLFAGNSVFKHQPAALISIPMHRQLTSGEHLLLQSEGDFYIIFLLSGSIRTTLNGGTEAESYEASRMIFVPMGTLVDIEAEGETTCLVFHFQPSIHLCANQCPERPKKRFQITTMRQEKVLTTLPLSRGVELWTSAILEYLQYSLSDLRLFDVKLQELFLLLRMNYARRMQEDFLRNYHCKRMGFSCQVFKYHLSCRNVEELAEKIRVTPAALTRMFDDEFGIPPLKWLLHQRARHVYKDLVDSPLSLTEIAERYYFSSTGYLSAFCRRMFGLSPMKIRKGQLYPDPEEGEETDE